MLTEDSWKDVTTRDERKKIQNRINQRAARLRKKEKDLSAGALKCRPYHVDRWRIERSTRDHKLRPSISTPCFQASSPDDLDSRAVTASTPQHSKRKKPKILSIPESNIDPHLISNKGSTASPTSQALQFPLSSDHLLHLIHHNVYRALLTNKALLEKAASLIRPSICAPAPTIFPSTTNFCNGLTVIHPLSNKPLPQPLVPTSLQMVQPHSSWLNMFPFPRFRDNLITWEDTFDPFDLCCDLFGDFINYTPSLPIDNNPESIASTTSEDNEGEEIYDPTTRRKGLIVWGEPWDVDGWEVTPGFMQKWAWLLEGCEYLIHASNRWRASRGEEPLQVDEVVQQSTSPSKQLIT